MGMVFDIKEFAVHDGPGIRLTVFFKGCPLRCIWCHNPEGISPQPEKMNGPMGSRIVGQDISAEEIAEKIQSQADVLNDSGGGVTFSGGEPLMQVEFLHKVLDRLSGVHTLLDTCGYCRPEVFHKLIPRFDMVHYDLKLIDSAKHRKYCGVDNDLILGNLAWLRNGNIPFVIRIPMIPSVTDTDENLQSIAEIIASDNLIQVELLGYNIASGGKYSPLGKEYKIDWDENAPINYNLEIFEKRNIKVIQA